MPRLGVLCFALVLALAAPASLSAQEAAPEAPAAGYALTDPVVADVDAFWAGVFAAGGVPYSAPGVVALSAPAEMGCGWIDPAWGPAAYCGLDRTIYASGPWYAQLQVFGDGFAWTTVLAHEWGHHVQLLLGISYTIDGATELQADCLSGAYAGDAAARGLLDPAALGQAIRLSAVAGDPPWLPVDAPVHGSGGERANAFTDGYFGGLPGCGIPL